MLVLFPQVSQVLVLGHVRGQKQLFRCASFFCRIAFCQKWLVPNAFQSQCGKCFSSVKHCLPCTVVQQKLKDHRRCSVQVQSVKETAAELLTNLKLILTGCFAFITDFNYKRCYAQCRKLLQEEFRIKMSNLTLQCIIQLSCRLSK